MRKIFSLTLFFIAHNVSAIVGISGGSCSPVGGALAGFSSVKGVEKFGTSSTDLLNSTENINDYKDSSACGPKETYREIGGEFRRCDDGSISYVQPKSQNNGYTGFCGETSASNVLYMQCKVYSNPETYSNSFTEDITPGTRPSSLRHGMTEMFQKWDKCPEGRWQTYYGADSPEQYISYIISGLREPHGKLERTRSNGQEIRRTPIPILIDVPPRGGTGRHWITVVDIEGWEGNDEPLTSQGNCTAVVNHWGGQYKVPCHRLAAWARNSGDGPVGAAVGSYPRVKFIPAP
ncbi:MAG: hypothetical protein NXH75_07385 [Halobacteriovoraceae bacterium]|nr:hypothetical protein [Halobacteriovoraceae bacterium]